MSAAALLARWSGLQARTRLLASCLAALPVLLVVAAALFVHPQRTALFAAPLHPEQLSEVQERLAAWNVPFTPVADNVFVEPGRRNELLLKLSMAGVPHAYLENSADVLSKLGALTPQSVIDAQTRDGLAGDIARALRGIDGVQDASIIIAPAKTASFADEQSRDASASVRLRTAGGERLPADAVAGVRAFVAASVPGLSARNVTLLDDRGVALDEAAGADQDNELQRSLQSALDSALGAGTAIVRVRVEYERRAITSKDIRRTPLLGVPVSSMAQNERFAGGGKQYDRSAQQLDRGSDTHESVATTQGARISRISAAVIVDASRGADLAAVKALAGATLGIDRARGDELEVEAVAFSHMLTAKKDAWWLAYGAIVPLLPTLVVACAALAALRWSSGSFKLLVRALGERAKFAHAAKAVHGVAPSVVRGVLRDEPPHAAAAIISALPAATAAAVLDLYPEHERAAIIRRMQRPASPLIPDAEHFIANA